MGIFFDEAVDKSTGRMPVLERMKARRELRKRRRRIFSGALLDFRATLTGDDVPPAPDPDDDEDSDTFWERIAAIWQYIVENQLLQKFAKFVVDEVLPAIVKFIAAIIPIFAVL
jgi:hypothetical protein